jgi:hypothetical protein
VNCVDFRRRRLSGLRAEPGELAAHAAECPHCARFSREVEVLDERIDEAARVPVPPQLIDRILLDQRLRSRRQFLGYAAAASIGAVAAAGGFTAWWARGGNVAQIALEHALGEAEALQGTAPVPLGQLVQAFADWDGKLKAPLGQITFLGKCPLRGGLSRHMVLRTAQGTAHVLLMPQAVSGRENAAREAQVAIAMPAGSGSLAIVGRDEATVSGLERLLSQQVEWS